MSSIELSLEETPVKDTQQGLSTLDREAEGQLPPFEFNEYDGLPQSLGPSCLLSNDCMYVGSGDLMVRNRGEGCISEGMVLSI